jgi:5-methylcytosine-specific restriction endonuclease McrA
MAEKVCIGCRACHIEKGKQQRCPECARAYERTKRQRRGTRQQRGYDRAWVALARQAVAAQPWCAICGTTHDLVVEHKDPATRGKPGLTLDDIQVLCRPCNTRKGGRPLPPSEQAHRHTPSESTDPLVA